MKITKDFSYEEFDCKDGTKVPAMYRPNVEQLARQLQVLRDAIGKPITIISGYRTEKHNKKVGGVRNSYHLRGMAADIYVGGVNTLQLYRIIERLICEGKMRQGGIGYYPDRNFVHYDIRGIKARWQFRGGVFVKALEDVICKGTKGNLGLWAVTLGTLSFFF